MIGSKQWLGVVALIVLLFVVMFYSGMFMHGDHEVECLPSADCQFDDGVTG